jgi:hypothetical protein
MTSLRFKAILAFLQITPLPDEEMCMQTFMMDGQTHRKKTEEGRQSNIEKAKHICFQDY